MNCSQSLRALLHKKHVRRSAVIVWTAISATVLLGAAALSVDFGSLKLVQAQLQSAADASAMAGAAELINPGRLEGSLTWADLATNAGLLARQYAARNKVDGRFIQLDPADIVVGYLANADNLAEQIVGVQPYNAIRVCLRKDSNSPNGPVQLSFARLWGQNSAALSATATGYLDGHVVAYRPDPRKLRSPLIPVSVRRQKWVNEIINAGGDDGFGYEASTLQIIIGPDGIKEISLFPEKQKADGSSDGAGDFGLLHIGNNNQGVTELAEQIQNGLSQTDVEGQFGQSQIDLVNSDGSPRHYAIDGTPGAKNSLVQLENDFRSRLGGVIGFFIHDTVTESGANSVYDVTAIQFGRVLMVNGQGTVNGTKSIVIQPVAYTGDEIITGDPGPIHETAGRIRLVR